MSDEARAAGHGLGGLVRPALRPWRLAVLALVAVLAVGSVLHLHSSGSSNGGSKGPSLAASVSPGASGGTQPGGGAHGSGTGSGAGGGAATPSGQGAKGGKAGASPTPLPTRAPQDWIYGNADVLGSTCGQGYEPGTKCTVYYHGMYNLATKPTGGVVFEVIIDGTVVATGSYVAPKGEYRFGGDLQFKVPDHAKKIVYQSLLEDPTFKVLASSPQQVTYGYG